MATMYSLFFGLLFTALCCDNGDGSGVLVFPVPSHPSSRLERSGIEGSKNFTGLNYSSFLFSLETGEALVSFGDCFAIYSLMNKESYKSRLGQYYAKYFLTTLNISEPLRRTTLHRPVFNDLQKVFLTRYSPRSWGDLLAYGVKYRKATNSSYVHFALEQDARSKMINSSTPLQSRLMSPVKILTIAMGGTDSQSECSSDEFCPLLRSKVERLSGMEDNNKNKTLRQSIIAIASKELGVREATGNNDGPRVEEYLRYTNLGPHHDWCAAYVSWVYGQAGLSQPRNPWSPALFPKARQILKQQCQPADIFGIYGVNVKRINHVGIIKEKSNNYVVTIEGNSNNRVESRRRHLRTIYAIADWVSGNQS